MKDWKFREQEDSERRFEYLLKRFIDRWHPTGTPTAKEARVQFEADLIILLRETQLEMHRQGMDSAMRLAHVTTPQPFIVKS